MKFKEEDFSVYQFPQFQCLVYFLCQKETVVYVGQTRAGMYRPYSHRDMKFDNIRVIPCKLTELKRLESYFINKYQPKYNIQGKKNPS